MSALLDLSGVRDDLVALRHDIHAHPETAFDEKRTSDLVASNLSAFGLDMHRGLGGTGVDRGVDAHLLKIDITGCVHRHRALPSIEVMCRRK